MKLSKLIKQHKTEEKSKLQNEFIITESKRYYGINISLLHKHTVIECIYIYIYIFFLNENNNGTKLLKRLNIKTKSLNENRNIEYK